MKTKLAVALVITLPSVMAMAADLTNFPPTEQPYGYIAPIAMSDSDIGDGNAKLYRPWFHNSSNFGDIKSHSVTSGGSVGGTVLWSALTQIETQVSGAGWSSRKLFTNSGADGVDYGCSGGSPTTEVQFHCGNHAVEDGTTIRQRQYTVSGATSSYTLGDIIHSAPVHVGRPDAALPSSSYLTFAKAWKNRAGVVYAGSNDGFLHAIDAASGNELWAFTPAVLSGKLASLASPSYTHDYAVDGPTVVKDAYANFYGSGSEWRTALVGALGAGGKGLYALDVTDPAATNLKNDLTTSRSLLTKFLWEFTSADDTDLGYTYGRPVIAKLSTGDWGVIVGNGYKNSGDGKAHLFVLSFADSNNDGRADVVADILLDDSLSTSNGLSTPAVVDTDGDGVADRVYAGDLEGNLWKINISSTTPSNWASTAKKIFAATDSSGSAQPILVAPQVAKLSSGVPLVVIGTGDHLLDSDYLNSSVSFPSTTYKQSIYGIIDDGTVDVAPNGSAQTRADLATAITFTDIASTNYRTIATNTANARGWAVDLGEHEHVLQEMAIKDNRLQLMINDRTSGSPKNWLTQISYKTGGLPGETVFDLNGDGSLNSSDDQSGNRVVAINKTADLASAPLIVKGATNDHSFINIWEENAVAAGATPGPVTCSMLWVDLRYELPFDMNDGTTPNGVHEITFTGTLDDGSIIDLKLSNFQFSRDAIYSESDCDADALCVHGGAGVDDLDKIDLNFNRPNSNEAILSSPTGNGADPSTGALGLRWDPTHIDLHRSNESLALGIQFHSNLRLDKYSMDFDWTGVTDPDFDPDSYDPEKGDPPAREQFVRRVEIETGACGGGFAASIDSGSESYDTRVIKDGDQESTLGGIASWDNLNQILTIDNSGGSDKVFNADGDSAGGTGGGGGGVVVDGTTDQTSQSGDDADTGRIRWRELTF